MIYGVFLDCETGGLHARSDAVLQVAAVAFRAKGGRLVSAGSLNIHVQPHDETSICRRALAVQGKDFRDIGGGETELSALRMLDTFLSDHVPEETRRGTVWGPSLWAHNAGFDSDFLSAMETRNRVGLGKEWIQRYPNRCTWSCSKGLWLQLQATGRAPAHVGASLDKIAAFFGIDRPAAHDALIDCQVSVQVLSKMFELAGWL
jgi:DNA polymerase III alpha subunit (gram-positive type)